jgi:hypothetical protein
VNWLGTYLVAVFWNWLTVALLILGINDLLKWLGYPSWGWLSDHRGKLVVAYFVIAQAMVYRELATRPAAPAPVPSPVVAENPDHAGLVEKVDRLEDQLKTMTADRDKEREGREDAEKREGELRGQLSAERGQGAKCDQLAALSSEGVALTSKLRSTRAAEATRREIDDWFRRVCAAMSRAQCSAFMAAPPGQGAWVGYPVEDGGYSQTIRGRSANLSTLLSNSCR